MLISSPLSPIFSFQTLSKSDSKLDSCELLREFFAMKSDIMQMKKELEEQRIAYKIVCEELKALKVKQDGDEEENRSSFNHVFTDQEKSCKLSQKNRDDQRIMNKTLFTELAECKLGQQDLRNQNQTVLEELPTVRDELKALKENQKQDKDSITAIRSEAAQIKKKQEAQDVKV